MAEGGIGRALSEKELDPMHCCPSACYSPDQWTHVSEEICRLMDSLGYGHHIRQARRDAYRKRDRLVSELVGCQSTVITTGSKGEGLTNVNESDTDVMNVIGGVMCLEDGLRNDTISKKIAVFILNFRLCSPGHCRLLLANRGQFIDSHSEQALVDDGHGGALLSSDFFLSIWVNTSIEHNLMTIGLLRNQRAGPSLPFSFMGTFEQDIVICLRCNCPSILSRWAARDRKWPPPDVVQRVVSMGAFVTPVGFQDSEYKHVEWRICFNTGEIELMYSLNDTQIKIYVIFKMIVKDVLKPRNKELTSFTVKNIVLWLAEKNQQTLFHKRSVLHWLREGLMLLRTVIYTKHLAYYMIPERNLMAACKMSFDRQRTWIATITALIDEGPRILLRLPKVRRAIIAHPEPLFWYSGIKTELEMLFLMMGNKYLERTMYGADAERDSLLQSILIRYSALMISVAFEVDLDGSYEELFNSLFGLLQ